MTGVYQIFIEDYCYWGSSKDCESRCADHLKDLERGKHCNNKMQNIFNKYKTFDFQIIVACDDRDVAYLYEQDYIDTHFGLDKCMNLSAIATKPPSNKGKKASAETRAKQSEAAKGRTFTDEHKANIGAAATGKTHTDETKVKLSEAYQNEAKFQCPHCGRSFRACHLKRWHGDNCKHSDNYKLVHGFSILFDK